MEEGNNKDGLREHPCLQSNAEFVLGEKRRQSRFIVEFSLHLSVLTLRKQRADPQNTG